MLLSTYIRLGLLISCSVWLLGLCALTQPPSIEPPVSAPTQPPEVPAYLQCDPQTLPFPLPPDVQNCQHLDIITDFQTNLSPEQVIQFYRDYFESNGWTRQDDGALPGMGTWATAAQQINVIALVEKNMTSVQVQVIPK